jgi:ribose transport system ATP-binding protein/inositol transport system ATP-binding protein
MEQTVLLEMKHVSKAFPGVKALDDVHIEVKAGEVHALLGENGAGKSTLIKILGGIHQPDSGEIYIDGVRQDISDVNIAHTMGIGVIHQELALAPDMTVAENIFMGEEPTAGWLRLVNTRLMNRRAQEILDRYQLPLDAEAVVADLTVAQQQLVEIARALSKESRIIVMDEPTATLSDHEVHLLFAAIRELQSLGVGIIYISHRMEELFEIGDRVTVLRDGKYVGTRNLRETNRHELIKMMVGRDMTEMFARPEQSGGETLLEVRHVTRGRRVKNCSFSLKRGEILGFFGLVGAGRTELMRIVFGVDKADSGEVLYRGQPIRVRYPGDAIARGIAMVPVDRKGQGAILMQDISFNITITNLKQIIQGIRVHRRAERQLVNGMIERLSIRTPSADQTVKNLSGGNQQKVVFAKWLATAPDVLILDEPTRGIDVGAKKEIYEIMKQLVDEGVSIIMVSSEMPELINMSNRVITMYEGAITGVLEGEEIAKENILFHATKEGEVA